MSKHQDIFSLISPMLTIFRYLGFGPYVMKGASIFRHLEYTKTYDVITTLLHFTGLCFYVITSHSHTSTSQLNYVFELCFHLIIQIESILTIVLGKIQASRIVYIWNRLHNIQRDLGKLGANYENYSCLKARLVTPIFVELLTHAAILIWIIVALWGYSEELFQIAGAVTIYFYANGAHVVLTNHQCMFLAVIENLIENFNYIMATYFADKTKSSKSKDVEFVNKLAEIHMDLSELLGKVNQVVSLPILITFGMYFCVLIVHLINVVVAVITEQPVRTLYFISNAVVVVYSAGKILQVVRSSEKCTKMANCTKKILIDVMMHVEDAAVKKELNALSLQIFHQKFQITAGGFFVLNYPIVVSIIGAVSTYVVILVQTDPNAYFSQHFIKREN